MNNLSLYDVLALITLAMLLGMFLGAWLFAGAINYCIRRGVMDVFIKGRRLDP